MTEQDIIGYAVGILLVVLVCGVLLFVTCLPLIDRWVEKRKKKRA
ncbi:MAG: hypothetical protein OXU31_02030 [Gammaproteobacteria bacterium]|nr:hypothetical protein [Gammaproteobacteria bacterium]MDD9799062.1 hypothetical protein [Gammaproteobacteria bacterium]MDD9814749.1 hypothetical protein [Gammaproteobacteria bacterium]MDD9851203.1 hypothetical protein [Gammaproteobacteria bacterium]MDD9870586.1 hypothetical protein [Gammaproteobacteria bacterium]